MAMNVPPRGGEESLEEAMRAALAAGNRAVPVAEPEDPLAAAFRAPGSADQYQLAVPKHFTRDSALEAQARQWFLEARLPQGLVNGILREYCRCLEAAPPADAEARANAELARDWGPDCARRIELARSVIGRCRDVEGVSALLAESGLGNNPWLIRSLAALADLPDQADLPATGGRL